MEMLHAQIQIHIVRYKCTDCNQNARHIVEFQPIVDILIGVDGYFGEIAHHVLMSIAIFQKKHTTHADMLIAKSLLNGTAAHANEIVGAKAFFTFHMNDLDGNEK